MIEQHTDSGGLLANPSSIPATVLLGSAQGSIGIVPAELTQIDATGGSGGTRPADSVGGNSASFLLGGSQPRAATELGPFVFGLPATRVVRRGSSEKRDSQGDSYFDDRIYADRLAHRIGGCPDVDIQLDGTRSSRLAGNSGQAGCLILRPLARKPSDPQAGRGALAPLPACRRRPLASVLANLGGRQTCNSNPS